jgi:hypothetical protein
MPINFDATVNELESLMTQNGTALATILADLRHAGEKPAISDGTVNKVALEQVLNELEILLQARNMRATSVFTGLQQRFGAALGEQLTPLAEALSRLNFKMAHDQCSILLARIINETAV